MIAFAFVEFQSKGLLYARAIVRRRLLCYFSVERDNVFELWSVVEDSVQFWTTENEYCDVLVFEFWGKTLGSIQLPRV
jgi:hypothetical protein